MKKLLGTIALFATAVSPAFADSTGVLTYDVREWGHRGGGTLSINGEAAEELYNTLQVQEGRSPDRPGDGVKYQTYKFGEDIACYRTVQHCRVAPAPGFGPRGPHGFPGGGPNGPFPVPGVNMPGVVPVVPPQPAIQPFQPACGNEDRVTYLCQTRMTSTGRMDVRREGGGGRMDGLE